MRKQHFRPYGQEIGSLRISPASSGGALARYESSTNNGTTWFDIMPDPADGTNNGPALAFPRFNGAEWVSIGQPAKLDLGASFSVSAWANQDFDSSQGSERVVSRDTSNIGSRSFLLTQRDNNGKAQSGYWKAGALVIITSASTFVDSKYHYHVVVDEGPGGDFLLYVDGVLEGTIAGGGGQIDNTPVDWEFGRAQNSSDYFEGSIDTVRYYDRALSADEIFRDYIAGKGAHQ